MFPKATFTSRFDLAHCLSQLKIGPWKNGNCETAYFHVVTRKGKVVGLPGINKTLIILLI